MLQKPATKQPFVVVPGYSRLFRRGAIYYFRVGVPNELRKAIGKTEIIKSLRTTDFQEAKRLVALESADTDARFSSERNKLHGIARSIQPLPSLSEAEIHRLIVEWFIGVEKQSEGWWEETSGNGSEESDGSAFAMALENLRIEEAAYNGGTPHYRAETGSFEVNEFLSEKGFECPSDSPTYRKLCEVFRRGRLESIRRSIDRVTGNSFRSYDPLLRDIFAHSSPPQPPRKAVSLGAFLDRFLKFTLENRSETTFSTYQTPVQIMRDVLGEKTDLASISKDDIERLCEVMKSMPKNAKQRYPGKTSQEAIGAARQEGDTEKLSPKTLENYFRNILAVFNFAVDDKLLTDNPASNRFLREQFQCKRRKKKKVKFTSEQLNILFQTPLYTGCIDDERGYSKPGENQPRRGRFWAPLLALFQGLRCNEACQLYVEDVKERGGIPYLAVRTELDEEELTDKRLKNLSSHRNIPVHPTLLKIGFLDFVTARRSQDRKGRLFPELSAGKTGRYSNPFSKWFGRFLTNSLSPKPKATFHSFRHHFRDALRYVRISDENIEALGGWAGDDEEHRNYGDGPTLEILLEDLSRVEYPALDLGHLLQERPDV